MNAMPAKAGGLRTPYCDSTYCDSKGETGMITSPEQSDSKEPLDILEMRPLPTSSKGLRTRLSLTKAARRVFEEKGFVDTRLIDITTHAGLSAGTFYTYFDSKEQIFAAVLQEAQKEMLHPGLPHVTDESDSVAVIKASTRAYLETYRRNAALMALMEQVSLILPEFRQFRQQRADTFVERNARSI